MTIKSLRKVLLPPAPLHMRQTREREICKNKSLRHEVGFLRGITTGNARKGLFLCFGVATKHLGLGL